MMMPAPHHFAALFAPVLIALLFLCGSPSEVLAAAPSTTGDGATAAAAGGGLTLLLCADDGTFSGMGELHFIRQALVNATQSPVPLCGASWHGWLPVPRSIAGAAPHQQQRLQEVALITTGIGSVNAALCTYSAFANGAWAARVRRVIYTGTAGMSPFRGGWDPRLPTADPGGCGQAPPQRAVALGSVCVTSATTDLICGRCVTNATLQPDECQAPDCHLHLRADLFGVCDYAGPRELARAVYATKDAAPMPPMPLRLQHLQQQWWAAFDSASPGGGSGSGGSSQSQSGSSSNPPTVVPMNPSVFPPSRCAEGDGRSFAVSGSNDVLCRTYSAEVLNKGNANPNSTQANVSMRETPCFVAMEGIGFTQVMLGPGPRKGVPMPPFAILRGAANYDFYPLARSDARLPGIWVQQTDFIGSSEYDEMVTLGYHFAIETTNELIFRYMATLP